MILHHVQVLCPRGGEDKARAFYADGLGMTEVEKPPVLAARGGCWFRTIEGAEIHVGAVDSFAAEKKAHPAFCLTDIDGLATRLEGLGFPVEWDDLFPGCRRFYTADGNGNRVEILGPLT